MVTETVHRHRLGDKASILVHFAVLINVSLLNGKLVAQISDLHPQAFSVTFSNVRYIDEVNALVGTELSLKVHGTKVSAVLKEFEGIEAPKVSRMEGTLVNNELRLQAIEKPSKLVITGNVGSVLFRGIVRHGLGKQTLSFPITLKRVPHPDVCCDA